jgi:acyl-CoA reductase-like NAD-dependent aldehyde dehydrogenase
MLFKDTTNDMTINREEIIGLVACVIKADDYEYASTMFYLCL